MKTKKLLSFILTLMLMLGVLVSLGISAQAAEPIHYLPHEIIDFYAAAVQKALDGNPEIEANISVTKGQWTGDTAFLSSPIIGGDVGQTPYVWEVYDTALHFNLDLSDLGVNLDKMITRESPPFMDQLADIQLALPAQKLLSAPSLKGWDIIPHLSSFVEQPGGAFSLELVLPDRTFRINENPSPLSPYPYDCMVQRFTDGRFLPTPEAFRNNISYMIQSCGGTGLTGYSWRGDIRISTRDAKIIAETDSHGNLITLQTSYTYKVSITGSQFKGMMWFTNNGGLVEIENEVCFSYEFPPVEFTATETQESCGIIAEYSIDTGLFGIPFTVIQVPPYNFTSLGDGWLPLSFWEIHFGTAPYYVQPAPGTTVTLKIPLPNGYTASNVKLYHSGQDGTEALDPIGTENIEGTEYLLFKLSSFSEFVLVGQDDTPPVEPPVEPPVDPPYACGSSIIDMLITWLKSLFGWINF